MLEKEQSDESVWLTTKRRNRSRWRWIGRVQKGYKSMKKELFKYNAGMVCFYLWGKVSLLSHRVHQIILGIVRTLM